MFSRSPVLRLALFLVAILMVISIALGTPVFADGGGGQPFPPDQSPSEGAEGGLGLLTITLLTILQFVL